MKDNILKRISSRGNWNSWGFIGLLVLNFFEIGFGEMGFEVQLGNC